jgi:hypothetical protein
LLRKLQLARLEVRAASLVNDVFIAETARAIGANVVTAPAIPRIGRISASVSSGGAPRLAAERRRSGTIGPREPVHGGERGRRRPETAGARRA